MALPTQCQLASPAKVTRPGSLPGLNGSLPNARRRRLPGPVLPVFLAVALSLASIAALVLLAAITLDRQATQGARSTVETSLQVEADRLYRMVADTSWWEPAYQHLIVAPDRNWADENIGSYLKTAFRVDLSLAMDAADRPTLMFIDGRSAEVSKESPSLPAGLDLLAQQARESAGIAPAPVTGYLALDGQPYILAVSAFVQEESGSYTSDGSVLVFGSRLDAQWVEELGRLYRVSGMHLAPAVPEEAHQHIELLGPDGNPTAVLAWPNTQAAWTLLTWLLPPLTAVILLVVLLTWRFFSVELAQRRRNEAELHLLATTDALSGVGNRRFFMDQAQAMLVRALQAEQPLTLVSMDIDHFKQVNDSYGHAAGDAVIRAVAQTMLAQLRETDLVARLGGEEFAALLPETGAGQAHQVVERVRRTLAQWPVEYGDERISTTVSIGVAQLNAGEGLESLLARADAALYRAKEAGRNRIVRSA